MDCKTARMMLDQGQETQELLAHLASCNACRTRGEATEFVRAPELRRPNPEDATAHVRIPIGARPRCPGSWAGWRRW